MSQWGKWTIALLAILELGLVASGILLVSSTQAGWPPLMAALGLIVGAGLGILAAPLDKPEARQFSRVGSIVSAFVGGSLLSKADRMFEEALKQGVLLTSCFLSCSFVLAGSVVLAAIFVWLWRKYGFM